MALLTLSPVFVTTCQWWSAALSVLSSAIASLACISLVVQVGPPGLSRKLAVAACFLVGLLFYPKGLFTIVLLLAIRLFCRASGRQPGVWPVLLGGVRDIWPTAIIVPIYLGVVHFGEYSSKVDHPDLIALARFIWVGWNGGFLAAVLGLHDDAAGMVVANGLLLALVVFSVVRNPLGLILWGGFILYFAVSIGVIGWNRAVPFGIGSAQTDRYYADVLCFFLAILMVALGRLAGRRVAVSSRGPIVAVVATIMGSVHLVDAGRRVPHLWYAGPERPAAFVANVRAVLSAAPESQVIADGVVPDYIMPSWMSPLNRYALFLRLFGWRGKVVNDHGARTFDDGGNLTSRG